MSTKTMVSRLNFDEAIGQLNTDIAHLKTQTNNLCDCNNAAIWTSKTSGTYKDSAVASIPADDTIRVTAQAALGYDSVHCVIDVTGLPTETDDDGVDHKYLYCRLTSYDYPTASGRCRLTVSDSAGTFGTVIGTITKSGVVFDVMAYDYVAVELYVSFGTVVAVGDYSDYYGILVCSGQTKQTYVPRYQYEPKAADILNSGVPKIKEETGIPTRRIMAHRGFRKTKPENTFWSFDWARRNGMNYIETDIRLTSDGVPVLIHDSTVDRTARNADGSAVTGTVSEMTYAEINALDFGIFMGDDFAGTKIPTCEEFIKWCAMFGIHPILEMKDKSTSNINAVITILEKYDWGNQSVIMAPAGTGTLKIFHDSFPRAELVYLDSSPSVKAIEDISSRGIGIKYMTNDGLTIPDEIISACETNGVELYNCTYSSLSEIFAQNDYVTGFVVEQSIMDGYNS